MEGNSDRAKGEVQVTVSTPAGQSARDDSRRGWLARSVSVFRRAMVRRLEQDEAPQSRQDLERLVRRSQAKGGLHDADSAMLAGVLVFHEKKARDVMRPRTDIVAIPEGATADEVWALVRAERYSRYPVYRETLDDVVGVFLAKDLWLHDTKSAFVLVEHVRPAVYVPDNRPAERVLDDLRKHRAHMAVVLDEFGGTAGILTLEDLIEEVIGDINDEYDFATRHSVEADGVLELSGALSLVDVRADYQLDIPDGDWNTLGGYVFGRLGRVARIGDRVRFPDGELEVVAMEGRRVAGVRVLRKATSHESSVSTSHESRVNGNGNSNSNGSGKSPSKSNGSHADHEARL